MPNPDGTWTQEELDDFLKQPGFEPVDPRAEQLRQNTPPPSNEIPNILLNALFGSMGGTIGGPRGAILGALLGQVLGGSRDIAGGLGVPALGFTGAAGKRTFEQILSHLPITVPPPPTAPTAVAERLAAEQAGRVAARAASVGGEVVRGGPVFPTIPETPVMQGDRVLSFPGIREGAVVQGAGESFPTITLTPEEIASGKLRDLLVELEAGRGIPTQELAPVAETPDFIRPTNIPSQLTAEDSAQIYARAYATAYNDLLPKFKALEPVGQAATTEALPEVVGAARSALEPTTDIAAEAPTVQSLIGRIAGGARNVAGQIMPILADRTTMPSLEADFMAAREPAIDKLSLALKMASRVNAPGGEFALAKSAELGKRVAIGEERLATQYGSARTQALRSALGGKMPNSGFEVPPELQLTPDEFESIHEALYQNGRLRTLAAGNASDGLTKLALGQLPTNSEIALLGRGLGADIAEGIIGLGPKLSLVQQGILSAAGLTKAVKSMLDVSAGLRQGLLLINHTSRYSKSFVEMFKSLVSEKGTQELEELTTSDPLFTRVFSIDPDFITQTTGSSLASREEAFPIVSKLAQDVIPGLRMSERAYTTMLNRLRFGIVKDTVENYAEAGKPLTDDQLAGVMNAVKIMSGRGRKIMLPFTRSQTGEPVPLPNVEMNVLFWSPRLLTSRFQTLGLGVQAAKEYASAGVAQVLGREAPEISAASKIVAKDLAMTLAEGTAILTALDLSGVGEVELDPRSSDFGKGRIGHTRFDFWGGFQPLIRYTAQLGSGERKDVGTGVFSDVTPAEVFGRFLRSKLAPLGGATADELSGTTFMGLPTTTAREAYELFVPLFVADVHQAVQESGRAAGLMTIPSALGVGVSTFQTKEDMSQFMTGKPYMQLLPKQQSRVDLAWQFYKLNDSERADLITGRQDTRILRRINKGKTLEERIANRKRLEE